MDKYRIKLQKKALKLSLDVARLTQEEGQTQQSPSVWTFVLTFEGSGKFCKRDS